MLIDKLKALFKKEKKEKQVIKRYEYFATLYMKNGDKHDICGHYPSFGDFKENLGRFISQGITFYTVTANDDSVIIVRADDIDYIEMDNFQDGANN
jgi:hypothetical protein